MEYRHRQQKQTHTRIYKKRPLTLSPRVANNPILFVRIGVSSPSNNRNHVVHHHFVPLAVIDDTSSVGNNRFSVYSRRDWTTRVNFRLDLVGHGTKSSRIVRIRSVFGHGRVGEHVNLTARAAAITGAAGIRRGTRRVHVRAKSIRRLGGTGNVRHAPENMKKRYDTWTELCETRQRQTRHFTRTSTEQTIVSYLRIVRNEPLLLNKLVHPRVGTTVTAAGHVSRTIQNVLDRQVDLVTQSPASNLDAVSQRRKSTVRPTAAAILRNVLIQGVRQITDTVNVTPIK
jgi:hypothetical protein